MKIKNRSFTVLLSFSIVLFSINCQAVAATFTPKGAIQGKGIDFLLNVAANVFRFFGLCYAIDEGYKG
jgi:hypothetical protein